MASLEHDQPYDKPEEMSPSTKPMPADSTLSTFFFERMRDKFKPAFEA